MTSLITHVTEEFVATSPGRHVRPPGIKLECSSRIKPLMNISKFASSSQTWRMRRIDDRPTHFALYGCFPIPLHLRLIRQFSSKSSATNLLQTTNILLHGRRGYVVPNTTHTYQQLERYPSKCVGSDDLRSHDSDHPGGNKHLAVLRFVYTPLHKLLQYSQPPSLTTTASNKRDRYANRFPQRAQRDNGLGGRPHNLKEEPEDGNGRRVRMGKHAWRRGRDGNFKGGECADVVA